MISKTQGIVLSKTKYSESSLIIKIFTRQHGLRSFILKATSGKRKNKKLGIIQQLAMVEIEFYESSKTNISIVKDISSSYHEKSMHTNIHKSCILLFLNEILYKSIKEEESNEPLFLFIEKSLQNFDLAECNYNDFHLHFMIRLSFYLGFFPNLNPKYENNFFDLKEGCFFKSPPSHSQYLEENLTQILIKMMQYEDGCVSYSKTNKNRKDLLSALLKYYEYHIPGFSNIKAFDVLQTIFSE